MGDWRPYDPANVWERMPWVTDDLDFVDAARGAADTIAWEAEEWDLPPVRFTWGEEAYGDRADDYEMLLAMAGTVVDTVEAGFPSRYVGGQEVADAEAAAVREVRRQERVGRRFIPATGVTEATRLLMAAEARFPHPDNCDCLRPACRQRRYELHRKTQWAG